MSRCPQRWHQTPSELRNKTLLHFCVVCDYFLLSLPEYAVTSLVWFGSEHQPFLARTRETRKRVFVYGEARKLKGKQLPRGVAVGA